MKKGISKGKNNGNRKKENNIYEVVIDVKGKESVKIIYDMDNFQLYEDEIRSIQKMAQKQREEMKKTYYAANTPISKTMDRRFSELFKRYVQLKIKSMPDRWLFLNKRRV